MKIIFGINVPYVGGRPQFDPVSNELIWIPQIKHKDLFFVMCDICGSQVVSGRLKRGLTTCSWQCNEKKWDRLREMDRYHKGKRSWFWETYKGECFKRDNYTCQKCGSTKRLECHHKIPIVSGGSNELSNLITLCHNCHSKSHPAGYRKSAKRMRENNRILITDEERP